MPSAFFGLQIGSFGDQGPYGFSLPGSRCGHERRLAAGQGSGRIGAGLQQQVDHRGVAVLAGHCERRDALPVGSFDVGAGADELLGGARVIFVDGA